MVSLGTSTRTDTVHAGMSTVEQLLPGAVDATELTSVLSLRVVPNTVTVYVIVTRAPTARSPVQVRTVPTRTSVPAGPDGVTTATASLLYVASSSTSVSTSATLIPTCGASPVLVAVTV